MTETDSRKSRLEAFFGVPVFVQFKEPFVFPVAAEKQVLPHADGPKDPLWIPRELATQDGVQAVKFLPYAVMHPAEWGIELCFLSWGPEGQKQRAVLAVLCDESQIAYVTRVAIPPEEGIGGRIVMP